MGVVAALGKEGNEGAVPMLPLSPAKAKMGNAVRARRNLATALAAWAITVAAVGAPCLAAPSDAAYTVANYPVDATAGNAVAAKQQAIADGQQAAFRALLKRIVPVTAYKQLSRVSGIKAADLISGVTVRSERNSSIAYLANLDFSYQADAVRSALSRQGIPVVDEQAPPVIVVTVTLQGNPPDAKNDTGLWRRAWTGLDLAHTITPVKVDDLKPAIPSDTVNALLAGDGTGLRALNDTYGTPLVVLAIADPDTASKKLTVTLAGRDAVGPLLLKRTYRNADGDLDYASQLAAVVSLGVLEGRWKAVKSGAGQQTAANVPVWSASTGAGGEDVSFLAQFVNPAQWDQIRTQLLDTPGIDALNIASVSDRDAAVSLKYPGGARSLANALGARGLSLIYADGGWVLRPNY
jgi:hypothetical protein